MRWIFWAVALFALTGVAMADEFTLEGGVLIAHAPPGVVYSDGEDYCAIYAAAPITTCPDEVHNQVDSQDATVWYVLAGWPESKQWKGIEFGMSYDSEVLFLEAPTICTNGTANVLEIPSDGFPGPNTGTALACSGTEANSCWHGQYVAVYFFVAYAYGTPGVLTFIDNPKTGFIGSQPFEPGAAEFIYEPSARGSLGILTPGTTVCAGPGTPTGACCQYGGLCEVMTEAACTLAGGAYADDGVTCLAADCPVVWACCVDQDCLMLSAEDCASFTGEFHAEEVCAADGGTFVCPSPAARTANWGSIKAEYR